MFVSDGTCPKAFMRRPATWQKHERTNRRTAICFFSLYWLYSMAEHDLWNSLSVCSWVGSQFEGITGNRYVIAIRISLNWRVLQSVVYDTHWNHEKSISFNLISTKIFNKTSPRLLFPHSSRWSIINRHALLQ